MVHQDAQEQDDLEASLQRCEDEDKNIQKT